MTANPLAPAWLDEPADANDLVPSVWSRNTARDASGAITFGGVSADTLASTFGTPLYVVDERDFRERAQEARQAFDTHLARIGSRAKVYYAGKAFLSGVVAGWVTEAGLNVDVCTGGELAVCPRRGS